MEFARPQILYLLLLVIPFAALHVVGAARRRRDLAIFTGVHLTDALAPGRSWRKMLLRGVLRITGLTLLILALAGPRFGSQLVKVEREGVDIVIALDTSLSMLAEDMRPSRLERAKQEIIDLISGLKGDRVGLVVFAGDAFPLCPLTVDYEAALMFTNAIDVNVVSEPGTAIGTAIEKSIALFEQSVKRDRAIILVTDGEGHEGDPLKQAAIARDANIRIYTIGIGNPKGELIPMRGTGGMMEGFKKDDKGETVMTRLDEAMLQRIAAASGGKYLPATREGIELKILYNEISGMEKKKIKGEFTERKKEKFPLFLAFSLFLLLLDVVIPSQGSLRHMDKRKILHTGIGALVLFALMISPMIAAAKKVDRSKVNAGNRYFDSEAYDKALVLYSESIGDTLELPENYQGVFYNMGNTLFMMEKYEEALKAYQGGYNSEDSVLTGSMLYNQGNVFNKTQKAKETIASYVQALHYLPDDPDILYNLELALKQAKEQEQQQQQQQKNQDQGDKEQQKDDQQEGEGQENQQQQQSPQESDSTSQMQQTPQDSTGSSQAQPQDAKRLSKEDALRILQALEEQEKNLQKEKRKAAFKRMRKRGKDW